MNLVYCQSAVLEQWLGVWVARLADRTLVEDAAAKYEWTCEYLDDLRQEHERLACTVSCASHLVTRYYKHPPPFRGDVNAFLVRKELARVAAGTLSRHVVLLSPRTSHFETAKNLFFAHCLKEVKEAFAGFEDYVEAALILDPPEEGLIRNVVVCHAHLPYILRKADWRGTPHYI